MFGNTGCVASMKSTEFSLPLVVDRIVTFLSGILGMNVENLGVCSFIYVKGKILCAKAKKPSLRRGRDFSASAYSVIFCLF